MMNPSDFPAYGEELEKRLRLETFPLAVRLLEREGEIPGGAKRPRRDFGHRLALCQGFSLSRRQGSLVAMLKEDMVCYLPVIALGLAEPPEAFFEGDGFISYVKDREAAQNMARSFPRLGTGKYIGVVSAPLAASNFAPDLVVVYCNSAQVTMLLMARGWQDGSELPCTLSFGAVCVYSLVPPVLSGECQVAIPCFGDRFWGLAKDDELVFVIPKERLEGLILGLRYLDKSRRGLPTRLPMMPEPPMPPGYGKIGRLLGMEVTGD